MKLVFRVLYCVFAPLLVSVICQEQIKINIDLGKNQLRAPWKFILNAITEKPEVKASANLVEVTGDFENPPKLICPRNVQPPFISLPCLKTQDCSILRDSQLLCCKNRCVKGIEPPKPSTAEGKHPATFFGIIQQTCPKEPLPELREIQQCGTDLECEPRICCPETLKSGENISYCRTPEPIWETIPAAKELIEPIRGLVSYMQCTSPPPSFLDLNPKPCENPLDCFPNLCCQEGGKRFCRPPKRSILTLIADVGQKVIPTNVARDFIKRIS